MNKALDMLMDEASVLLVKMEYLEAERLCEEGLARAKGAGDWGYVARVLLPLQECRRQRRMIAVEGAVLLGSEGVTDTPAQLVARHAAAAVVLTGKHDGAYARAVQDEARKAGRYWEVLLGEAGGQEWKIKSLDGGFEGVVGAPPAQWQSRWLLPLPGGKGWDVKAKEDGTTPGSWVVGASEKLGDAGLAWVKKTYPKADGAKVKGIEVCLESVSDHEFLIQEYQKVARAMHLSA
jgi:hypothetical protein